MDNIDICETTGLHHYGTLFRCKSLEATSRTWRYTNSHILVMSVALSNITKDVRSHYGLWVTYDLAAVVGCLSSSAKAAIGRIRALGLQCRPYYYLRWLQRIMNRT